MAYVHTLGWFQGSMYRHIYTVYMVNYAIPQFHLPPCSSQQSSLSKSCSLTFPWIDTCLGMLMSGEGGNAPSSVPNLEKKTPTSLVLTSFETSSSRVLVAGDGDGASSPPSGLSNTGDHWSDWTGRIGWGRMAHVSRRGVRRILIRRLLLHDGPRGSRSLESQLVPSPGHSKHGSFQEQHMHTNKLDIQTKGTGS